MPEADSEKPSSPAPFANGFVFLVIALLAALLVPGWVSSGSFAYPECVDFLLPVALPAMTGFLIVLSAGAVDLSVWPVMCLGGIAAALCMASGVSPLIALLAACVAGGAAGAGSAGVTAAVPAEKRCSATVATAVVGICIMAALWLLRPVTAGGDAYPFSGVAEAIHGFMYGAAAEDESPAIPPLMLLRVFSSFLSWSLVLVVFMESRGRAGRAMTLPWPPLILAGALGGIAGFCMILEQPSAVVPARLLDDLRIPAAAVLSGVLLTGGRERLILPIMLLPACALVVSLWELQVWPGMFFGYSLSLAALLVFVLGAQLSFRDLGHYRGRTRIPPLVSLLLCLGGVAAPALPSACGRFGDRGAFIAGAAVGIAGLLVFGAGKLLARKGA